MLLTARQVATGAPPFAVLAAPSASSRNAPRTSSSGACCLPSAPERSTSPVEQTRSVAPWQKCEADGESVSFCCSNQAMVQACKTVIACSA